MSHDNAPMMDIAEEDDEHHAIMRVYFHPMQKYSNTLQFILLSLVFVLFGIGVLMLLVVPLVFIYFYIIFKRRKCYITPTNVVLKQEIPMFFCMCYNTKENHVQIQNIVDVIAEQSWIQKCFDCWTIRIQNPGQSVDASSDLVLDGVVDANKVKRLLLDLAAKLKRGEETGFSSGTYGAMENVKQPLLGVEVQNAIIDISASLKRIETMMQNKK